MDENNAIENVPRNCSWAMKPRDANEYMASVRHAQVVTSCPGWNRASTQFWCRESALLIRATSGEASTGSRLLALCPVMLHLKRLTKIVSCPTRQVGQENSCPTCLSAVRTGLSASRSGEEALPFIEDDHLDAMPGQFLRVGHDFFPSAFDFPCPPSAIGLLRITRIPR